MLSLSDIQTLSQICNHTWGDSTTKISPSIAIKGRMVAENILQIEYYTVFKVVSDRDLIYQQDKIKKEAETILNEYVKRIKKEFKETTKKTLKVIKTETNDALDMISVQRHVSLNATVKYILKARLEVSV